MKFLKTLSIIWISATVLPMGWCSTHANSEARKIAIIASGYYDSDDEGLKYLINNESKEMKAVLDKNKYETTLLQIGGSSVANQFIEQLANLIKGFKSGRLKKGDQVLFYFHAHGGSKNPVFNAHRIFFGDGSSLELGTITSDLKILTDGGMKVGLVDTTCYSGNSIDLAESGVCVISSQNRYNVSRAGLLLWPAKMNYVEGSFSNELKNVLSASPGNNLEDIFLTTRKNLKNIFLRPSAPATGFRDFMSKLNYSIDLPEISSQEQERMRQIWDQLFFTNINRRWRNNYEYLACTKVDENLPKHLRIAFEMTVKASFGEDSTTYENFLALSLKRRGWIDEVALVDKSLGGPFISTEDTSKKLIRRKLLTDFLEGTEDDYQRLLGKVMMVERELYDEIYSSLKSNKLSSNPCREFVF